MPSLTGAAFAISLLAGTLLVPCTTDAQGAARGAPACPYRSCALSIAPRWNGLAVVRGAPGRTVANLNFFWPRDVSSVLRGDTSDMLAADSAVMEARRAVRLRRIGATLTNAGAIVGAVAAVRALQAGRLSRGDGALAAAGVAALGVSVPFQFAADGALSRAVWWHNLRYSR